jgi:hypothetical protein
VPPPAGWQGSTAHLLFERLGNVERWIKTLSSSTVQNGRYRTISEVVDL